MSLIHNERVKLTAVCLNTLATTTVAAGVIAPVVAVVFGLPTTVAISPIAFLLAIVAWFLLGLALHLFARRMLGRLQE